MAKWNLPLLATTGSRSQKHGDCGHLFGDCGKQDAHQHGTLVGSNRDEDSLLPGTPDRNALNDHRNAMISCRMLQEHGSRT
ncbi:UNVERIFIED_CONTAM: hypothetical protein K2H54_014481 [Gekko kuhli]